MTIDFEEVRADIAAFADDDEDVIIEKSGQCLFVRSGREVSFRLYEDAEGRHIAEVEGEPMTYRRFLSHHLADLPVLAERILAKREPPQAYVDGLALYQSPTDGDRTDRPLKLLREQVEQRPAFVSRVLFVTADAGQGKTALLREFQHQQAESFLAGRASSVFWHVDLQGRQLLRLSEALMGDLSDLRVSGLWMPAVVRLLRQGSLVLAIDGFDELAAEQGGSDALGALAVLVQQMGGRGSIVAASRRTFFDTDDYVRRSRLFARSGAGDCEFDQLSLHQWKRDDAVAYLGCVEHEGRRLISGEKTYDAIAEELGSADHPMLTRPFLVTQIARALLLYGVSPHEFIRGMDEPLKGVGAVIEAFVQRELAEKWKLKDTGEPFLDREQHLRLLADVAEEMFRGQRATIDVDVLETITTLLLDEWNVDPVRRQQVIKMIQMHVLLPRTDSDPNARRFDHEEFRDWFTAYAMKDRLLRLHGEGAAVSHDLLSVAHLPDATARFVCALIERTPEVTREVLAGLVALVKREWRPTYLQMNVGTIIPSLLDEQLAVEPYVVDANIVFSSLVCEGTTLRDVAIKGASFVNASLARVNWTDVVLEDCNLGELTVDRRASYVNVVARDCRLEGVRVVDSEHQSEESREYAPERMKLALEQLGIRVEAASDEPATEPEALAEGEVRKAVRRVLGLFRRTTFLPETVVRQRFGQDAQRVLDDVLPLMERYDVIGKRQWKGSGRYGAWGLASSLESVEKADGDERHPLHSFWVKVDELDAGARR